MSSGAPISLHYRGGDARDGTGSIGRSTKPKATCSHRPHRAFTNTDVTDPVGGRTDDKDMKALDVPAAYREAGGNLGRQCRLYRRMADLATALTALTFRRCGGPLIGRRNREIR
jgi:hypothetical protein